MLLCYEPAIEVSCKRSLCLIEQPLLKTGCTVCRAQCKMKMYGPLLKNYKEFQDTDSRELNQAWDPSKCRCTGCTPMRLALLHLEARLNQDMVSLKSTIYAWFNPRRRAVTLIFSPSCNSIIIWEKFADSQVQFCVCLDMF